MAEDESKQVEVMLGPYTGKVLTMPAADADAAIAAKWAIEPRMAPFDATAEPSPNLSDEERQAAEEAAALWAATVRGEPVPEPGKNGDAEARRRRDMKPEEQPGYATRDTTRRR